MKRSIKINNLILTFLLAVVFCLLPFSKGYAEEQTGFFTTLDYSRDMTVIVEWDVEQPLVIFTAPDGTQYNPEEKAEGTSVTVEEGTLTYVIKNAMAGDWYVTFDKKGNEGISIYEAEDISTFALGDITVTDVNDTYAYLEFTAMCDEARSYSYDIYITADTSETSRGEKIASGWAYTDEPVNIEINMLDYGTSSNYRFYVYAYYAEDGADIYDSGYSDTFSYVNPNTKELTTAPKFYIEAASTTLTAEWEPQWGYTYLIAVYTYTAGEGETGDPVFSSEPDFYTEIDDNSENTFEYMYSDVSAVKVTFAEKDRSDVYSTPKEFTVDLRNLPTLNFEDGVEATNKDSITVYYSGFADMTPATVESNIGTSDVYLGAEGSFLVVLEDDYNDISVTYEYAEDIYVKVTAEIYRDNIPPRIYMSEDYTDVTTDASKYTVAGTVSDAVTLTIGGQDTAFSQDGSFNCELSLNKGENIFEVIAADALGNSALYTIKITCTGEGAKASDNDEGKGNGSSSAIVSSIKDFIPGIVAAICGLVLIIMALVSWKKEKKGSVAKTVNLLIIFFDVVSIAVMAYGIYMWHKLSVINKSTEFIDAAAVSVSRAYSMLQQEEVFKKVTLISLVAFLVLTVALILFNVIHAKVKAKKTEGQA